MDLSRSQLIDEAEKQSEALRRIAHWRTAAMFIAALGVLLIWFGFGSGWGLCAGLIGIALLLSGTAAAVILNVGIRNGRENVEKIIDTVERKNN